MSSDRKFSVLMEGSPLDPPSPSCCKSALSNGQVLQVLTADNTLSSAGEFDMQGCTERLRTLGIQVSCTEYTEELHQAVMNPEVRRYLFCSSRAFSMAIAVLCYVTLWVNLYTSLRLVSTATHWSLSVLVSVSAALLTAALVLLLDRHGTRMNTNTDVRLAGVNERLLRHNLLLGITELLERGRPRVQIFESLEFQDVLSAGLVCRQWLAVSRDEFLWRELFYQYYGIPRAVPRHPAAVSWLGEFQRLFDSIPCVEVCALKEHHDQVLHLSFSHSGCLFASCSKDCTVKIWNNDLDISLLHSSNMREFNWGYTQFSQFNADDTLLLVSGVYIGRHHSSSGEIAVISLDDFTLLSRVRNKPYDVFGCWLNESHLISGNLHWIGNVTSCSVLWLNKAFQDVESENMNVVKRLFKIQNRNASTIRTVMVADCRRHDSPELLLDYEEQAAASGGQRGACRGPRVFDLGSDSEEEERGGAAAGGGHPDPTPGLEQQLRDNILQGCRRPDISDKQLEAKVSAFLGKTHTRHTDPSLLSDPVGPGDKKYLIFTTGSLTYSPHQIGIMQILPEQMTTTGPVLGKERRSEEFFDSLDHVFDIHGHIIGMGLSPDHRYLYVNSRAWPAGCVISDPMAPPPIAEEIDLHVFDLKTLREERRSLRAHRAFTPNDECFFIFLDVSRDFVASGAEDKHGYIWDRHYNICLAKLQHDDVVNSVAFSPVDQELLLTASDDATIKVWRSPRTLRVSQASRPRPRRLLFNWLRNTKQSQSQS